MSNSLDEFDLSSSSKESTESERFKQILYQYARDMRAREQGKYNVINWSSEDLRKGNSRLGKRVRAGKTFRSTLILY